MGLLLTTAQAAADLVGIPVARVQELVPAVVLVANVDDEEELVMVELATVEVALLTVGGGELKLPVPQLGWTKKPAVLAYAVPLGAMISNSQRPPPPPLA